MGRRQETSDPPEAGTKDDAQGDPPGSHLSPPTPQRSRGEDAFKIMNTVFILL